MKLTGGRLHEHRRISQHRAARFGAIPADAATWWEQIQTIAAALEIETRWEHWQEREIGHQPRPSAPEKAAAPPHVPITPTGQAMRDRLAELAAEHRKPKPKPEPSPPSTRAHPEDNSLPATPAAPGERT